MIDWHEYEADWGKVRLGFTDIDGGVSVAGYDSLNLGFHVGDDPENVVENRRRLQEQVAAPITWMSQIHSNVVRPASSASVIDGGYRNVGEADGITLQGGQAAAVMVADCVPLLLFDASGPRAAAVHVGRAGLDNGIAYMAARALETMDANMADIIAIVGPAICGQCYEVPAELAREIGSRHRGAESRTSWGTPAIDISRALVHQLEAIGVQKIEVSQVCTREDPRFFSHRRETSRGRLAGRFAGVIEVATRPEYPA